MKNGIEVESVEKQGFISHMFKEFKVGFVLLFLVLILLVMNVTVIARGRDDARYLREHEVALRSNFVNAVNLLGEAARNVDVRREESWENSLMDFSRGIDKLVMHVKQYDNYLQHRYDSYEPVNTTILENTYKEMLNKITTALENKDFPNATVYLELVNSTLWGDSTGGKIGYHPEKMSPSKFKEFVEGISFIGEGE